MTAGAIIFMVLAMIMLWGGVAVCLSIAMKKKK